MNSTPPEDVHCNFDEMLAINVHQTQLIAQKQVLIIDTKVIDLHRKIRNSKVGKHYWEKIII